MKPNKYQKLCLRTVDENKFPVERLPNWCMGIAGESGELIDHMKKHLFHDHPIDREYIKHELGDMLWYMSVLAEECGIKLNDIMKANIKKLKARYPDGFDTEKSINRDDIDDPDDYIFNQSPDVSIRIQEKKVNIVYIRGCMIEIIDIECIFEDENRNTILIELKKGQDIRLGGIGVNNTIGFVNLRDNLKMMRVYLLNEYDIELVWRRV